MKKFNFMSMLTAVALLTTFVGCSDDVNDIGGKEKEIVTADTQVRITIENDATTRANNDEAGDGNEEGTVDEYLVKNATLYFFDSSTNSFKNSEEFTGFVKESTTTNNRIVWVSQNRKMQIGIYDVVVLVNGSAATTPTAATTLDDFMKDIKAGAETWITSAATGLLMASRNGTNAYVATLDVTAANTPENPAVVATDVERTVAKITLKDGTSADYSYEVTEQSVNGSAADVTITLSDYRMLNLRNEYFTFRHAATDFTPVNPGIIADNVTYSFGDLADENSYIMDPKTFMKNTSMPVSINGVSYTDWAVNRGFESTGDAAEHILGYCQENTMRVDAQKKGYGTAIVFKGQIKVDGITIATDENLYYDKTNSNFYADYTALQTVFTSLSPTVNYSELAANNIEAYKNGICTYVYYIKHADNSKPIEMGIMEYAMVRNNVYKVAVTGINAPGKGLVRNPTDPANPLDPANPTNPTDPDPSIDPVEDIETEEIDVALKVQLTVKPWIIRNNEVVLGK